MLLLTMIQTSQNFAKSFFLYKIEEKNQRIYRKILPQVAKRENLCPTNSPPEAMREYPLSCKFTAVGNVLISSFFH
jgi:hypothetical protein